MNDDDLSITRQEEARALRECVRLGYMRQNADGKIAMTDAGMRRVEGMVWSHAQRPVRRS